MIIKPTQFNGTTTSALYGIWEPASMEAVVEALGGTPVQVEVDRVTGCTHKLRLLRMWGPNHVLTCNDRGKQTTFPIFKMGVIFHDEGVTGSVLNEAQRRYLEMTREA